MTDIFERMRAERRRTVMRRRLVRILIIVAVVAGLGFGVYALYFSSWFVVKDVRVNGTQLLTTEQVNEVAQVPVGTPVLRVDISGIAHRVGGLKPVAKVEVERALPSHVTINVTERRAVYQRVSGKTFQWVDADGVIFHTADKSTAGLLPVTVAESTRLLRDAATVVHWIPADVKPLVASVRVNAIDDITLQLKDKRQVKWGSAEQSELKSEVLGTLMQQTARVYDVSAPLYPTTR